MSLRVLVACEYSGIMRDACITQGLDAISCDLRPTERPGPHFQGDVRDMLKQDWAAIFAFSDCTRKANSGVRWLAERNLWADLDRECELFNEIGAHACPHISRENSLPHKYAVERVGGYTQIIHPWQHGHGERKPICLWLKGLPPITPTNIVAGREQRIWKMSPGPDRAKERARMFSGVAKAMAEQWTKHLLQS